MAGQESLLRAAISAACRERAPRKTIAAIAAAVTTALVTAAASQSRDPEAPTGNLEPHGVQEGAISGTSDKLVQDLRAARAAKRRLKRQKKRQAEKAAKAETPEFPESVEARTWEEAYQNALAAAGKRKAEDVLESQTSMSTDTADRWRPVVDATVLAQIHSERARPTDLMTRPSPSTRVDRLQEGKGGKVQDVDRGYKQPARRRPP